RLGGETTGLDDLGVRLLVCREADFDAEQERPGHAGGLVVDEHLERPQGFASEGLKRWRPLPALAALHAQFPSRAFALFSGDCVQIRLLPMRRRRARRGPASPRTAAAARRLVGGRRPSPPRGLTPSAAVPRRPAPCATSPPWRPAAPGKRRPSPAWRF